MMSCHFLLRGGLAALIAAALPIGSAGAASGEVPLAHAPGSPEGARPAQKGKASAGYQQEARKADPKQEKKPGAKPAEDKAGDKGDKSDAKGADAKKSGKPAQVGTFGDWGVFVAQGAKDKTCYALAIPKDRAPAKLARDPAYVFVSNRPGENIRSEVSVVMGFVVKPGADVKADIGGATFDFVPKGANAWIKNVSEEGQFVEALKKGSKLIVKAPSAKGNVTTDQYSLAGLSQALEKVQKECP